MTSTQQASVAIRVAIPGLLNDIVTTHVFAKLPDPRDLAVLRAVSSGMRDAVDATGRRVEEFGEEDAAERGYLSTLKCLRRRGVLKNERLLSAAARGLGSQSLKALRKLEFPWDRDTCAYAAKGGHLQVLQWTRANGCPWDKTTCAYAAMGGHLEVLKWAREGGCPWDERTCAEAAGAAISIHCSGRAQAAARGTRGRARTRRRAATSIHCSGRARTAVLKCRRPIPVRAALRSRSKRRFYVARMCFVPHHIALKALSRQMRIRATRFTSAVF